ncbi:MAG: hypothetical protein RLZZ227_3128 [Pseudomonadota bacterium]|jgi:hypothetical protein
MDGVLPSPIPPAPATLADQTLRMGVRAGGLERVVLIDMLEDLRREMRRPDMRQARRKKEVLAA